MNTDISDQSSISDLTVVSIVTGGICRAAGDCGIGILGLFNKTKINRKSAFLCEIYSGKYRWYKKRAVLKWKYNRMYQCSNISAYNQEKRTCYQNIMNRVKLASYNILYFFREKHWYTVPHPAPKNWKKTHFFLLFPPNGSFLQIT